MQTKTIDPLGEPALPFDTQASFHNGRNYYTTKNETRGICVTVSTPAGKNIVGDRVAISLRGVPLDFIKKLAPDATGGSAVVQVGDFTLYLNKEA